jgi:NAD(P)-dependent dehydrogenase (short-subunit alcohol dehydrogenase family)
VIDTAKYGPWALIAGGSEGDPYLDIAPVALFLAGEGCRYLTGNTLFVDGGSHINGVAWTPDLDGAS